MWPIILPCYHSFFNLVIQTMNELIYGIRVVKFFAWENFFLDRVNTQRSAELSSLKARKYLDALCVYFWATTPVLISILTFTTYSLLGNQLTAPKVKRERFHARFGDKTAVCEYFLTR